MTSDPPRPVQLFNLVPESLHQVYCDDPIVMAIFTRCSYQGTTREEALIECVRELSKERARVMHAYADEMARRGPEVFKP